MNKILKFYVALDPRFLNFKNGQTRNGMKRNWSLLFFTAALCSGCGTTTLGTTTLLSQANEFAQAGIAFSDSLDPVLDQSLEAKVRANSLLLRKGRQASLELCDSEESCIQDEQDKFDDSLSKDTENLYERAELYRKFRAHAQVLRNYFQTLASLASSDQADTLGQSAQRLVSQASILRNDILENAQAPPIEFGDVPKILVSQVANTFRSKALERVLKETAPAISIELELQTRLLDELTDQTSSDLELAFQIEDDKNINDPFSASTDSLPADWADKRLAAVRRGLDLTSVGAARKAAGTLQTTFEALVENRLDETSLGGLIQDLNNLATLALEVKRVRDEKEGDES